MTDKIHVMTKLKPFNHNYTSQCNLVVFHPSFIPNPILKTTNKNKHKFVQKDAKVEVLEIIMTLIEQSCAELGEQSMASRLPLVQMVPIL